MERTNHQALLATHLERIGLLPIAHFFRLFVDNEPLLKDGEHRATLEIGYPLKGRFKLTASSNMPTLADAEKLLSEGNRRQDLASMIELGVQAMPEALQPELPAWVKAASQANRIRADLGRARGLAKKAAADEKERSGPF